MALNDQAAGAINVVCVSRAAVPGIMDMTKNNAPAPLPALRKDRSWATIQPATGAICAPMLVKYCRTMSKINGSTKCRCVNSRTGAIPPLSSRESFLVCFIMGLIRITGLVRDFAHYLFIVVLVVFIAAGVRHFICALRWKDVIRAAPCQFSVALIISCFINTRR